MSTDSTSQDLRLQNLAIQLLMTSSATAQLDAADAGQVIRYMRPCRVPAGETFMREGDHANANFMLLVLEGEVQIESHDLSADGNGIVVRVVGPGAMIGELSLLDGLARSVNCVALSDLHAMALYRDDFLRMLADKPQLGAQFVLSMATRIATHLREITSKFKVLMQMNKAMSAELLAEFAVPHALQAPLAPPPNTQYIDWPDAP